MQTETFQYTGSDNLKIHTYKWSPETAPKAIFLLIHGSIEHAKRYEHFAEFLTNQGYLIYAPDLRGHGITGKESNQLSYFAEKEGWDMMLQDVEILHKQIKEEHPDLPIFLFGHSMGSFTVRDYIANYSGDFQGVILSGSTIGKPSLARLGIRIGGFLKAIFGQKSKTPFMHAILYGSLNKKIKKPKTRADFISKDEKEVQKYLDDELCGVLITIEYGMELAKGSLKTSLPETFEKTPNELPIFIISGKEDPVGGKEGDEVIELYDTYKKHGCEKATMKLYDNARHELLNELEPTRQETFTDIGEWMEKQLS